MSNNKSVLVSDIIVGASLQSS